MTKSTVNLSCAADASRRFVYALDMDKLKPRPVYRERQGGNGFGVSEKNVMYTLDATIVHAVAVCTTSQKGTAP